MNLDPLKIGPCVPNFFYPYDPVSSAPSLITEEMVRKAIGKMNLGKAPGPSNITVEMMKASPEESVKHITALTNCIIQEGKIPVDWSESFIINCFKGKGDALDRGNYRWSKAIGTNSESS